MPESEFALLVLVIAGEQTSTQSCDFTSYLDDTEQNNVYHVQLNI